MSRATDFDDVAADDRAEAERQQRDEQRARDVKAEITALMENKVTRRFAARLIYDWCGVAGVSFALNTVQMAQNEGNRRVGIDLRELILLHCPDKYIEMEKERLSNG